MRHSILNFTKWLFGILGISITGSCLNSQGPIICEYGTPHCEYGVKGKVIDADSKQAVKGVCVTLHESVYNQDTEEVTPHKLPIDSTVVNTNGEFELRSDGFPQDIMFVRVKDLDPQNDGKYIEKNVQVALKQTEDAPGTWNQGIYSADIIIELTRSESE